MTAADDYELLDFGDGRKLERFGGDRAQSALLRRRRASRKSRPELWDDATARLRGPTVTTATGLVDAASQAVDSSRSIGTFAHATSRGRHYVCSSKPSPSGQVGVFPEQRDNWDWIARQVSKSQAQRSAGPLRVLNLFAYTGGSTLAAAAAGAEVVHIDAARNIVERARQNAELSGFADRPIRWIAEDATKFCQRELKRGNQYDAVILDPPSYGHGPKGEPWKIERTLAAAVADVRRADGREPRHLCS